MVRVGIALLRIAEDRVTLLKRELDDCHPDDNRKRSYLQERLRVAKDQLKDRDKLTREIGI